MVFWFKFFEYPKYFFYRSVVHELVQSPPFKEPRKYVRTHQKKPKEIFQIFQQAQRILEFFPM